MKVLAIDQGTTGTKAFTLDEAGTFTKVAGFEHAQHYPQPGWVEHDAEELLSHVQACIAAAGPVDAIGIDNQGETLVAWDAKTGKPCHRAIVWQDDRTKDVTERLKSEGAEELTLARAGLPLDPYFSATKMRWIMDNVPEAKVLLTQGRLRIATSDAFFLDRLAGQFATDVTTASRTSLMSLDTLQWDDDLLKLFGIPREVLPDIRDTTGPFGNHKGIAITANLVDQQAALAKGTLCRRLRPRWRRLQCGLGHQLGAVHWIVCVLRRDQCLRRAIRLVARPVFRACPLWTRLPALGPQRCGTVDRAWPRHHEGRYDAGRSGRHCPSCGGGDAGHGSAAAAWSGHLHRRWTRQQ